MLKNQLNSCYKYILTLEAKLKNSNKIEGLNLKNYYKH